MPNNSTLLMLLNDALKTENSIIQMLRSHARNFGEREEFRDRFGEHLQATERHAERVKECIQRLGSSPSKVMETVGTLAGTIGSVGIDLMPNQMVKMVVADYAAENMEIALYEAIVTAAESAGDTETEEMAREILAEEEEMAAWLRERIPEVSRMQVEALPETA